MSDEGKKPDTVCSISGCTEKAKHHCFFDNTKTGERIIDLHLCDKHGGQMQRTYFPNMPEEAKPKEP